MNLDPFRIYRINQVLKPYAKKPETVRLEMALHRRLTIREMCQAVIFLAGLSTLFSVASFALLAINFLSK